MLLKERIACVGIGQCGSNYVSELEKLEFYPYYINTSLEDLDTIETDKKNKYHIKATKGMAKNRIMAEQIIHSDSNDERIAFAINDQYAMVDIIYLFYSLSGGTGGTMGNFIAESLKDVFPDKIINVVAIKGKSTEDIGLQANAIESLKHLKRIQEEGIVTQIHLLDNDSRDDIFSINKDFALCFDKFISFDVITAKGNLDEEEKEKMLMQPGMAVILEFENEDFGNGLSDAADTTFYAKWTKNPELHGLILNSKQNLDINIELIKDVLGMPNYTHSSIWDNQSNILFAAGMSFNDLIENQLNKNAIELSKKKKKIEEESIKNMKEDANKETFDTSSVISSYTNNTHKKNTIPQSNSNFSRRRRRSERNGSETLNKYKDM